MLKKTCCTQANPTLPAMAHKSNPWKKSTAKVRCERRASPAMRNAHAVSCSLAASSPYIRGAQLSTAVETGLSGGSSRGPASLQATARDFTAPGDAWGPCVRDWAGHVVLFMSRIPGKCACRVVFVWFLAGR